MSKTDHSRPLRVKAMDLTRSLEESHDHRNGPCDLPPRPTKPLTCLWGGDATTSCYWTPSHEFMVSPEAHCNCQAHSKKRDDYALNEAAARRTANRRAEHDALVELSEHGLFDNLSDVETTAALFRRWADELGEDASEIGRLATLREHLTATTGLPETSLVVDVLPSYAYECCADCSPADLTGYRVEVLHNDGRREVLRFADDPLTTVPQTILATSGASR